MIDINKSYISENIKESPIRLSSSFLYSLTCFFFFSWFFHTKQNITKMRIDILPSHSSFGLFAFLYPFLYFAADLHFISFLSKLFPIYPFWYQIIFIFCSSQILTQNPWYTRVSYKTKRHQNAHGHFPFPLPRLWFIPSPSTHSFAGTPECEEPMGVENGELSLLQITVSSVLNDDELYYGKKNIRLDSKPEFYTAAGAWVAEPKPEQFVRVSLPLK